MGETRILFTGGGSAGHVTPNIGLIERCQTEGWGIHYAGSERGIEKTIIAPLGIPFHHIESGKLRRYFSWQNFIDPFKVLLGIAQAVLLLGRIRPHVIFSKGGFVSVPIVLAGWLRRIPVIIHESDVTPGLANRLCFPFANHVCVTFRQTMEHWQGDKISVTGTPVRKSILDADAGRGRHYLSLESEQPVVLVFGGSLGAMHINRVVRENLQQLVAQYQIVHICGKGNIDPQLTEVPGYHQLDYLSEEFGDVMSAADLVICRAGANSIYEILVMGKPNILIPLPAQASRGDQIVNARTFGDAGFSQVIYENELTGARLMTAISASLHDPVARQKLSEFEVPDSVATIFQMLRSSQLSH